MLTLIQWNHPIHGEILETACDTHDSQLLVALRTLGIGSKSSHKGAGPACDRCAHPEPPRLWIGTLTEAPEMAAKPSW